jgi:hypothetical protein
MDANLLNVLAKLKCAWTDKPTDESTALLIDKENPDNKAYLLLLSQKQMTLLAAVTPVQYALLKFRIFFQRPGRDVVPTLSGYVAFSIEEVRQSSTGNRLIGNAKIPYKGAYANGGKWKGRAKESLAYSGSLPDGLLFDSSVIVNDIKEYIDGIEQ